jgi:hypothetical protein
MNPKTITCTPTAVDADGVCASQTPGAGAITINGALAASGVATIGAAQLLRLTSGGDDQAITFTFVGTDADGASISETVAGTNASNSDTTKHFKTISSITKSGASAGTIIVGNLIDSVSPKLAINPMKLPFSIGIGCVKSGTVTYGLEQSYEEGIQSAVSWFAHASITSKSANADGSLLFPAAALRLHATASTAGSVTATVFQAG